MEVVKLLLWHQEKLEQLLGRMVGTDSSAAAIQRMRDRLAECNAAIEAERDRA